MLRLRRAARSRVWAALEVSGPASACGSLCECSRALVAARQGPDAAKAMVGQRCSCRRGRHVGWRWRGLQRPAGAPLQGRAVCREVAWSLGRSGSGPGGRSVIPQQACCGAALIASQLRPAPAAAKRTASSSIRSQHTAFTARPLVVPARTSSPVPASSALPRPRQPRYSLCYDQPWRPQTPRQPWRPWATSTRSSPTANCSNRMPSGWGA